MKYLIVTISYGLMSGINIGFALTEDNYWFLGNWVAGIGCGICAILSVMNYVYYKCK